MSRHSGIGLAALLILGVPSVGAAAAHPPVAAGRVTILYDAFGDRPGLERDWGFSTPIEYGGRRILFDAGNDGKIFARNVRRLGVDLRRLDFAVISHRHGDHTGGPAYLLRVNPAVTIYAPNERFGIFGSDIPATIIRPDNVHEIFGGLHLVTTPDTVIARIVTDLRDAWRLNLIAPGHCTGEPAFDALARTFGARYVCAGLGAVIPFL